jgi:hypothetical protein
MYRPPEVLLLHAFRDTVNEKPLRNLRKYRYIEKNKIYSMF